jgi:hypothetical protein
MTSHQPLLSAHSLGAESQSAFMESQSAFMIAAGAALGIFGIVLLAYRRLLSPDHQLRLDDLQER